MQRIRFQTDPLPIILMFAAPISSLIILFRLDIKKSDGWLALYFKRRAMEEKKRIEELRKSIEELNNTTESES